MGMVSSRWPRPQPQGVRTHWMVGVCKSYARTFAAPDLNWIEYYWRFWSNVLDSTLHHHQGNIFLEEWCSSLQYISYIQRHFLTACGGPTPYYDTLLVFFLYFATLHCIFLNWTTGCTVLYADDCIFTNFYQAMWAQVQCVILRFSWKHSDHVYLGSNVHRICLVIHEFYDVPNYHKDKTARCHVLVLFLTIRKVISTVHFKGLAKCGLHFFF